jgi:hypothetical protein
LAKVNSSAMKSSLSWYLSVFITFDTYFYRIETQNPTERSQSEAITTGESGWPTLRRT